MSTLSAIDNLQTYETSEVASHYASLDYLTPCEQLLFDSTIKNGDRILDLGVGGGRTTPYLVSRTSQYVGVDYAASMIEVCRNKFPGLNFMVADASDLSTIADESLDAVIFSFNGIDYLVPDQSRHACLRHIHRTLAPGGSFIFSSHNPRAICVRPAWNRQRLLGLARKFSGGWQGLESVCFAGLTAARMMLALGQAAWRSLGRMTHRLPQPAFWGGEGNLIDSAHGGLLTHFSVPSRVIAELNEFGFRVERVLGDDYPEASQDYVTRWYYYVFTKS